MSWLFIALINPVAHALVNHFDKYLLSRYVKESSVGALILFSSLFGFVALPIIFLINQQVLQAVSVSQAIILMANGALLMVAVLLYLYALESHEASYVVPLFQLIPVIGFFAGFLILGEIPAQNQIVAGLLIVLGGTILALEIVDKRPRLKVRLLGLMLGSSTIYAVNTVIFKYIAVEQGFLESLFWDMAGKAAFGIILFIVVKKFRNDFIFLLRKHHVFVLGLNVINEVVGMVGEVALVFAALYAPVAIVQSVGGLQPLFVFIFGVVLTLLLPKIGTESLLRSHILQKIIGIGVIMIGLFYLM